MKILKVEEQTKTDKQKQTSARRICSFPKCKISEEAMELSRELACLNR